MVSREADLTMHRESRLRDVVVARLLLGAALVCGITLRDELNNLPLSTICRIAVPVVVLSAFIVVKTGPRGIYSLSAIYFLTLSVFHLGLVVLIALGRPIPTFMVAGWLESPFLPDAVILATVGVLAFSFGCSSRKPALRDRLQLSNDDEESHQVPTDLEDEGLSAVLVKGGFAILVASLGYWIVQVLNYGGTSLLLGTYTQFLQATSDARLGYAYFGIGIGVAFLAASLPSRLRSAGLLLFGVFAVIALPLGLRGEVLFPLAAAIAIASRRRRLLKPMHFLIAVLLVLAAIGALRQVRQVGLSDMGTTSVAASPVDGLAELGGSVRPLSEVLGWHAAGESFREGDTYIAPLTRPVDALMGRPRPSAAADDRLFNVEVSRRIGPIGGSPMAEAYHNWGVAGLVLRMLVTGVFLAWLDRVRNRSIDLALVGALFVPLLIEVRNNFGPLPSQMAIGVLCLAAIYFAFRARPRGPAQHQDYRSNIQSA